jgi:hypothetical protein
LDSQQISDITAIESEDSMCGQNCSRREHGIDYPQHSYAPSTPATPS